MPKITKKVKPKRKPGERANLSREAIVEAGLSLLEAEGADGFTARALAKKLGVFPGAVLTPFGSFAALRSPMAAKALEGVALPFAPGATPAGYIRELFRRMLGAVIGRGAVADLAVLSLVENRLTAPLLLERLSAALLAGGVQRDALPAALDLVFAQLLGMVLVETGFKSIDAADVCALPPGEFPTIHKIVDKLGAAPPAADPADIADRHSSATLRALGIQLEPVEK